MQLWECRPRLLGANNGGARSHWWARRAEDGESARALGRSYKVTARLYLVGHDRVELRAALRPGTHP
jgi:hypothetical protein